MNEDENKKKEANVIHVSRSLEPQKQEISPELAMKHKRSSEMYPDIDLSESEYVVKVARRHPIGLLLPIVMSVILFIVAFLPIFASSSLRNFFNETLSIEVPSAILALFTLLLIFSGAAILFVSFYVFKNNKLYLTNESVIQRIQISLFSKQEQSVSLASIEDSSYKKSNVLQYIFDYGDIRLSTIGEETTYKLSYVASPKKYMTALDHAVEAFKNGRPFDEEDLLN